MFRLPFVRKPAEASSLRNSSNSAADNSKPSSLPTSFRTADGRDGFLARQGHPNQHKVGNGGGVADWLASAVVKVVLQVG